MSFNLEEGVYFQVNGEIGQYNSLPLDIVVNLMKNLQDLLQNIALSKLSDAEAIDLNQFKVELCDFNSIGGAAPKIKFTPRFLQTAVSADFKKQRYIVNREFKKMLATADEPQQLTEHLRKEFPDIERRNTVVRLFHALTNAAGNSPIQIVKDTNEGAFETLYPMRRMTVGQRDSLVTEIEKAEYITEQETYIRKVQVTKIDGKATGKSKILAEYPANDATEVSFMFNSVEHNGRKYEFFAPIHCKVEYQDDHIFTIKSEILDIMGKGETEEAAVEDFQMIFDGLYRRFYDLADEQMDDRLKRVRGFLISLVTDVIG